MVRKWKKTVPKRIAHKKFDLLTGYLFWFVPFYVIFPHYVSPKLPPSYYFSNTIINKRNIAYYPSFCHILTNWKRFCVKTTQEGQKKWG